MLGKGWGRDENQNDRVLVPETEWDHGGYVTMLQIDGSWTFQSTRFNRDFEGCLKYLAMINHPDLLILSGLDKITEDKPVLQQSQHLQKPLHNISRNISLLSVFSDVFHPPFD